MLLLCMDPQNSRTKVDYKIMNYEDLCEIWLQSHHVSQFCYKIMLAPRTRS